MKTDKHKTIQSNQCLSLMLINIAKFTFLALIMVFTILSCVPPKEEVKYTYNYDVSKVYNYSLNIDGRGILSYFLFSFSGNINIYADLSLYVSEHNKRKLFTIEIKNIDFKSSMEIDDEVKKFLAFTNITLSFYMDEKGIKEQINNSLLIGIILDILIPVLPEISITNEITYKTFNVNLGNVTVRNEISNITVISPTSKKEFLVNSESSILSLELENNDIVVADIKLNSTGRIVNYILQENNISITSKTTIPLYYGKDTKVVGFKGNAVITLKLKDTI